MSRYSLIGCKTCGSEARNVRLVTPAFAGDPHARECDDEWHDASVEDSLREEVEKRIRAAWGYDLNEVVEVAVEMIWRERRALAEMREKWGHAEGCHCYQGGGLTVRDPRCAPLKEK